MVRKLLVSIVSVAVIVVIVASVSLIVLSEEPHVAFISERVAEGLSGQNYSQSILSTYDGSGLTLGSSKVWQIYYLNESTGSGFNYNFQVQILKFNNTTLAVTAYLMLAGLFTGGNIGNTGNGTHNGFHYTYATEPQEINESYGTAYYWGAWGYSGDLVFKVTGQSPLPPKGNMSEVAIDQINAMTALHI